MRWQLVFFLACLSPTATQVAHTEGGAQQPTCDVACRVNPFTAPAGCDCSGAEDQAPTPAPVEPAPQTEPAEPVQTPPAEPLRPTEPGVPDCETACRVNPFTAPPTCECASISTPSGGGGVVSGAGSAGGTSPQSIVADGVVAVRELLDYMEELYRARIAGVQHYYFFERMVVAQPQQAARSLPPVTFRLASTTQSPSPAQGTVKGIDTMTPVARNYKKVQKAGRPGFEPATRREVQEWTVKNDPEIAKRGTASERRAAEAMAADPSQFFGALAQVADKLAGKGAGAGLREEQKKVSENFEQDEAEAKRDSFQEDVLGELLALKKVQDAELAAKEGGESEEVVRSLYLGHHIKNTLRFHQSRTPCASQVGCTLEEIFDYLLAAGPFDLIAPPTVCLVWRPTRQALADFSVDGPTGTEPGIISEAQRAELWLPIGSLVVLAAADAYLREQAKNPGAVASLEQVEKQLVALGGGYERDRVIRMKAVVITGLSVRRLDRTYTHFRPVETGAGPPMVEPHKIREELGQWVCGEDVDIADLDLGDIWEDADEMKSAESKCVANIPEAVVDRLRTKFTYNQGYATSEEENRAIMEQLGVLPGMEEPQP